MTHEREFVAKTGNGDVGVEPLAAAAGNVTLLTAATAAGPGASTDLTKLCWAVTMSVAVGGVTPDNNVAVRLEISLDNANWFSAGQKTGPGIFSSQQDVFQYIRANVISIASGNVTVQAGALV